MSTGLKVFANDKLFLLDDSGFGLHFHGNHFANPSHQENAANRDANDRVTHRIIVPQWSALTLLDDNKARNRRGHTAGDLL